ncbi:DUF5979 domain-containing protein [uncultured Microbacterium sp.]|uniref:DUF5979 domain-containing protein n=1 Tax=uncultured Microbacterium sp. TaxID=191216 RepID=UPI0025FDE857|nr:DUF5979 domain-containing protein [uncultured Microbacterium sp.]
MTLRRRFAVPVILATVTALLLGPAAPAQAADSVLTFSMTTTDQSSPPVPVSSVPTGSSVSYLLAVQCSGTVACQNVSIDLSSQLVLGGQASYAGWTSPVGIAATLTPTPAGARIDFQAPLPVGFAQTFPVTFGTQNWTTLDGTVLDMVGHATGSNVVPPPDASRTVTLTAQKMTYSIDKHPVTGYPAYAGGPDFSYDVWLRGDPALSGACASDLTSPPGGLRLREFTLSDTLPPGAQFVSASAYSYNDTIPAPTYSAATNTVTAAFSSIHEGAQCGHLAGGVYPTGMRVTVRWPATAVPSGAPPVTITNTAEATGTYIDGSGLRAQGSTQHQLEPFQARGQGYFVKGLQHGNSGDSFTFPNYSGWVLTYGNDASSTVSLTRAEITDPVQPLDVDQISFDPAARGTLEWTASDGSAGTVALPTTFSTSALPAGTRLASFRIIDTSPLAPGSSRAAVVTVKATTAADIGKTFENCASARLSFDVGVADQTPGPLCATWRQVAAVPLVWVGGLLGHDALGGAIAAGQPVRFHAAVQGDGTAAALHPQMTVCAPAGWSIDPGSFQAADAASAGFSAGAPFGTGGKTCTTLTWPSSVALTGGAQVKVDFSASASTSAPSGANVFGLFGGDSTMALDRPSISGGAPPWGHPDSDDVDGDGNTTEYLADTTDSVPVGDSFYVAVVKSAERVDGTYGADPRTAPAQLEPGVTDVAYRVRAANEGNTAVSGLVVYDVLPHAGDKGISSALAGVDRGSQIDAVLRTPIVAPAGVTIAYSASTDPCRPEVTSSGSCVNDWSPTVPTGGARAVRATFAGALAPAAAFTLDFTVDLSAGRPGQIACNSVASATDQTLATEPSPACVRLHPVGSLVVRKSLVGAGADVFAAGGFDFRVLCTLSGRTVLDERLRLSRGPGDSVLSSAPYAGLPAGSSCVVTETDSGGADSVPAPVTVQIVEDQVVTADLTNRFSAATLSIAKAVDGPGASLFAVTAREYPIAVTCQIDDGGTIVTLFSGTVNVPAGGRRTVETNAAPLLLPLGARCFAIETDKGYAAQSRVDHDSFANGVVVTAGSGDAPQQLAITATNSFDAASFSVSKEVTGGGPVGPYSFIVSCTVNADVYPLDPADRSFVLRAGESRRITVTPGAVCTVRESDVPFGARAEITDSTGDTTDGSVTVVGDTGFVRIVNVFSPVGAIVAGGPVGGMLALTGRGGTVGSVAGILLLLAGIALLVVRHRRHRPS